MSTFNQPSLGPGRVEREKEVPEEPGKIPERPTPEKVSPTQQGKFLGELEKKEKKKESKAAASEKKEEEVEETETGIFGLAGKAKVKKPPLSEEGGEEEWAEEEGEEGGKEKGKPPANAPMLPPRASEQAQAVSKAPEQAQAHAAARPVEGELPKTPVRRGPVEEHVPGTPVRRGPVVPRAEPVFKDISEEKERVAFQSTLAKKEEAAVAPPISIVPQAEISIKAKQPTVEEARVAREALIELFKQTVDAVATLVTKATTTTVVTIKQPPIFEGASILVTEYSSARKEYNITFANLSPDARRLIETAGSENQLRQALIDKGYTLHMMTIETRPLKIAAAGVETAAPEGERKERRSAKEGRGEAGEEGGPVA